MTGLVWLLLLSCTLLFGCAGAETKTAKLASAQGSSTVADLTGNWSGTIGRSGSDSVIYYELQQQGAKVMGSVRVPAWGGSAWLEGTVTGDTFTYTTGRDCCAELTIKGDTMAGLGTTRLPIEIKRVK